MMDVSQGLKSKDPENGFSQLEKEEVVTGISNEFCIFS